MRTGFFKGSRLERGARSEKIAFAAGAVAAVLFFFLDQFTKSLIVKNMALRDRIKIIDGFFNLTYITNDGAAWNILAGRFWLLLAISGTVAASIVIFIRFLADGWRERIYALSLILSGIAGNAFDRLFRGGEVVDFLQFHIGKYYWPSFNVADSCICVGVFIFVISNLLRPERVENKNGGVPPYVS